MAYNVYIQMYIYSLGEKDNSFKYLNYFLVIEWGIWIWVEINGGTECEKTGL